MSSGYGDWRQARSIGIGTLDGRQSMIVVIASLFPIFAAAFYGLRHAAAVGLPAAVVALLAVSRRDGIPVIDLAIARCRWQYAHWRGETTYQGQVFAPLPQAWDLPGVLAPLTLVEVEEPGHDTPIGVVWNTRTGIMSATLLLSPTGALLTDQDTAKQQVSAWGDLLASLADDESIRHIAVTIELIPATGTHLADNVRARISPDAPRLAQQVMHQVTTAFPNGTSHVRARLTLSVDPTVRADKPSSAADAAAEVARVLIGLPVTAAGVEVLRRATPTDLLFTIRSAFDPTAATAPPEAFTALDWADAGPVFAEEHLDHYVHDGCHSVSYALLAAPRQRVAYDVLFPLLKPGRYRRRVTLLFRTLPREQAGAVLEREANMAAAREYARRKSKRDPTAREIADRERALRAARQEAQGAGLVQFSLFVTTTVTDPADLPHARREVERAAGDSKLKLRIARSGQAAAFAVGLPVGLYPSDL